MGVYQQISINKKKTIFVMVFFVMFLTTLGYILGQARGGMGIDFLIIAFIISLFSSFFSYFYGDKLILSLQGAVPAQIKKDFHFYTVCENLALASGLPMPKLYVIETQALNAFATGRDPKHAVVCVTRGLLDRLDRSDIEGVVAHELSHIKNYDIRLMLIVAVLVGTVASLSQLFLRSLSFSGKGRQRKDSSAIFFVLGLILALLSPLIASLIQLFISRKREYLADASAVLLTRNPEGLIDALEKISQDNIPLSQASEGTAHLFIANPFKKKETKSWFVNLFNTHPPIEERIRILRLM